MHDSNTSTFNLVYVCMERLDFADIMLRFDSSQKGKKVVCHCHCYGD